MILKIELFIIFIKLFKVEKIVSKFYLHWKIKMQKFIVEIQDSFVDWYFIYKKRC